MVILWTALALLVSAGVGWPVTTAVLRLARSVDTRSAAAPAPGPSADGDSLPDPAPASGPVQPDGSAAAEAVLRGGLVIGLLERLAVTMAILVDQPVAIAYVVAIKGLGRYPELKQSPAASERFIIGTLASMLWAAAAGAAAKIFLL